MNRRWIGIGFLLLACSLKLKAQSIWQRPALRLHHLQAAVNAGATRLSPSGDHGTGYAITIKEQYNFTGVLYRSAGINFTYVQGWHQYDKADRPGHYHGSYISLPLGGGFDMGDDRGRFYTGMDALPTYFFDAYKQVPSQRRWGLGFGLEMGFTIKVGPREKRGFQLGMQGVWQWQPPFSMTDRRGLFYSFAGCGLIIRF